MYNIFCIGDSVTFGIGGSDEKTIGWCYQLKISSEHRFWNLGIPGDTSKGLLKRKNEAIIRIKPTRENIFIVATGLNDLGFDGNNFAVSPDKYKENILEICNFYNQYGKVIILQSTPISPSLEKQKDNYGYFRRLSDLAIYNQILENMTLENNFESIKFKDFEQNFIGDDGLHPNQLGYNYMAKIIQQKLKPFMN